MRKLLIPVLLFCSLWTVILRGDAKYYRYRDNRQLYYTERGKIYRYSDNRQILFYRGEDPKLVRIMILMLADM